MKLISSADTLNFLTQSAPRPWAKRMLLWMIYDGELSPYFEKGSVTPFTSVFAFVLQDNVLSDIESVVERDEAIINAYPPFIAEQLVGHAREDRVYDEPTAWDENDEAHQVGAGFFVHAEERDWEAGKISGEIGYPESKDELHLFWDAEEHLSTDFDRPQFTFSFSGLSFSAEKIELLIPTLSLSTTPATSIATRDSTIGRTRKWDWEGALARLVVAAQHPDGLPTGHGAQAKIERLLAEWFVAETGDSPASSQIRQRASKMMRLLKKPDA